MRARLRRRVQPARVLREDLYDMGVFDDIETTPAKTTSSGGVFSSVTAPAAPAKAGGIFAGVTNTPQVAAPADPSPYFQGKESTGTFLGISDEKDPYSGRPYFAYRLPGATSTTTDTTRVAPETNPEIAQPTPKDEFENPRMPESASENARIAGGATADQQLDHRMALAEGGSNAPENLKLVPTSENQAASTDEGVMAQKIADGSMSLFQAQLEEAKNKGLPTPFVDQAPAGSLFDKIKSGVVDVWGAAKGVAAAAGSEAVKLGEQGYNAWSDFVNKTVLQPYATAIQATGEASAKVTEQLSKPPSQIDWANAGANELKMMTSALGAVSVPGMAPFAIANNIPVVGHALDPINWLFQGAGAVGSTAAKVTEPVVNALPISQADKDELNGAIQGVGSTLAQFAVGAYLFGQAGKAIEMKGNPLANFKDLTLKDVSTIVDSTKKFAQTVKDQLPQNLQEAQRGFVHIPGLGDLPEEGDKVEPKEENKIQTPATSEDASQQYREQVLEPQAAEGKPVVIGADDMKDYFGGDYDLKNHPIYSKASNDLLMEMAKKSDNPKVIMTAGGPGSGKTELVKQQATRGFDGVVYDSNLGNYEGAKAQITQLRALGKKPEIHMMLRDPAQAFDFTKLRESAGGHPVSEGAFVRNHAATGVPAAVLRLAEEDHVPVKLIDAREANSAKAIQDLTYEDDPIATLKKVGYTKEQLQGIVDSYGKKPEQRATLARIKERSVSAASRTGSDKGQENNDQGGSKQVLRGNGVKESNLTQEKSRFATARDIIKEIGRPKQGEQGLTLNRTEIRQLVEYLSKITDPELTKERGIIYKPYGYKSNGNLDIILGETGLENSRLGGGKIVAEIRPDRKLNGHFRIHATRLDEKEVVGRISPTDLKSVIPDVPQLLAPSTNLSREQLIDTFKKNNKNFAAGEAKRALPVRNQTELEEEIAQTKDYLQYHDEALKNDPAKGLLKYYGGQDPYSRNLDDIFAHNVYKGAETKSSRLDDIVTEHGFDTPADAHEGVLKYLQTKEQNADLHTKLKTLQEQLKDVQKAKKDHEIAESKMTATQKQQRVTAAAARKSAYMEKLKAEGGTPGLTRRVVTDRNGVDRLTPDPLANPSNFYQRVTEIKKADPDRGLNEMTHISSQDIAATIQRVKDRADEARTKAQAIETSRNEKSYRLSFKDKVLGSLRPISHLPKAIEKIARDWKHGQLEAVEKANTEYGNLPGAVTKIGKDGKTELLKKSPLDKRMPTDEAVREYTAIQHGKSSPLRGVFDRLYNYAEGKGLDVPYRKDYLPQVYREDLDQVKVAVLEYMRAQGVDEETADGYIQGIVHLPDDVALRLKVNPFFEETKAFPTYGVAAKYGLSPKFTNAADLVANYRFELEKTLANKKFTTDLIDQAKLLPGNLAPEHWEHVTTNFVKGDLYAPPELARMLNGLYTDQATMGVYDTAVHYIGLLSRKAQEIHLSGAIPYTNIHFFDVGQVIKEFTAGNFKAIEPAIKSNSIKAYTKYWRDNQLYSSMMARQGIDVSSRMGSIKQIYSRLSHDSTWLDKIGIQFHKAFLDKSFGMFLPSLYLQVFKDTYDHALGNGMDAKTAETFAGDVTRTNFGLLDSEARAQATSDTLSGLFFAPIFRESVFGTLANAMKSVSTELRNPAFYRSRRLVAGMVITYGMYNVFNKMMNGQYMWQNPNGHEFELRIPLANGDNMYIPWMPSFLALPRGLAVGTIALAKGDFPTAVQEYSGTFSLPLQIALQVYANKDYFGNAIYKATDSGLQKSEKLAQYMGLQMSHPFVQALVEGIEKKKPLYQLLSEAATLPLKFQSNTAIGQGQFYDALDTTANKNAANSGSIAPTYDQVQQLAAAGKTVDAQKIVDALTPDQYKSYVAYKKSQEAKNTTKAESTLYPQYQQIQQLIKEGKTTQAQQKVDAMSDADYRIYGLLKKRFSGE